MRILLSGPVEGHLEAFHKKVWSEHKPHWIVCAGDYGVHPDPKLMDRAAKKHAGKDFAKMAVGMIMPPVTQTLIIAGVHDDQQWLNRRVTANNTEVLANVHYLHQGYQTKIGWEEPAGVRVTGLGRAYSAETYGGSPGKRAYRHYTRHEVERACSSGPTDLFVCYEHLEAPGIRNIIFAVRPKLILTVAHPNIKLVSEIQHIPVIALGRQEMKLVTWSGSTFVQ